MKRFIFAALLWSSSLFASEKVGVLFGSFGDIDNPKTELQDLVRNTLTDPDILPLHPWLRRGIADLGWYRDRRGLFEEYAAIGGKSDMRRRSKEQAEKVAAILRDKGLDAAGYAGFTMTFPFVSEALSQAKADGVSKLVVIYQGAQYSKVTTQILFRHVREYLKAHPEWDVEVTGVRSFSDDPRFFDLVNARLVRSLSEQFSSTSPENVCIFLPMHGQIKRLIEEGDPYEKQALRLVKKIEGAFTNNVVSYGFQNHDEIPFIAWTTPNTDTALADLTHKNCEGLLINGLLSFTVDSLETLYDHAIDEPNVYLQALSQRRKQPVKVYVEPMFNGSDDFVSFMSEMTIEALQGTGDLIDLRQ